MHLGGDRNGLRLNRKYKENLEEPEILAELDGLVGSYSREQETGESFGDFIIRKNIV